MCTGSGAPLPVVWWSIMVGLTILNLGVSIAALLLVCRRRYLQPQAPRHNSWSYESRPRIPLRPRPYHGFEANGMKRHTVMLPEPATYATVV